MELTNASISRFARRGFTLVEVLAVVSIIAILLSVAAVGIQRIDRGQATTSALALSEAVFNEARSLAIARGTRARVVIHNELNDADTQERERYRALLWVSVFTLDPGIGSPTPAMKGVN